MIFEVITLFPEMFKGVLEESIIKIAQRKNKIKIRVHNLRKWTTDRHRTADDKPYGGGAGMVMKIEPVYKALKELLGKKRAGEKVKIILTSPRGKMYDQARAKKISRARRVIVICGHYEGVDERVSSLADEIFSIGDYILTGGEIPAMVILDSVVRLLPGVLGAKESLRTETFERNLLEYPHYTRPRDFAGMKVPEVLLNGNHDEIRKWREEQSERVTKKNRPDLMNKIIKSKGEKKHG